NIINGYGPTENTTFSTTFRIDKAYDRNIPIGRPINNSRCYILGLYDLLQPVGVPGELCLAGDGLASGYLNNPESTAEKFIQNPYSTVESGSPAAEPIANNVPGDANTPQPWNGPGPIEPLYRTGDLARWLDDGNIQFLGRIDQQVKIRGFRIEPGEIENRLLEYDEIASAFVMDRQDKNHEKYLCAYLVPTSEKTFPGKEEIRERLAVVLPAYMLPSHFVLLEQLPLTANGKIDRRALPEPEAASGKKYEAPADEIEVALASVWADVLGLKTETIGTRDNFFHLGGHSLKATLLTAAVHKALDIKLPLTEVFAGPSIKEMARFIREAAPEKYASISAAEKKDYYVASSAQKRLFVLQNIEPDSSGYNIPSFMTLEGELDRSRLEKVFITLIKRHESLRTSLQTLHREPHLGKGPHQKETESSYMSMDPVHMGEEPVQRIHEEVDFEIAYYKSAAVEDETPDDIMNRFVRPFDLTRAPLARVGLIVTGKDKHIMMVDMHHVISDGVSQTVLVKEFVALYSDRELPPLRIHYKDYSEWQQGQRLKQQETYWLNEFAYDIPVLELPADYPRPIIQSFAGNTIDFRVAPQETLRIKELAAEGNYTLFMIVLAMFYIFLARLSGREDIVVGTPIAGRRHQDLQPIIGMFVNTLALRNNVPHDITFRQLLETVKNKSLQAFENQEYPFEDLVDKAPVHRDASRNPLFDAMFSMPNLESTAPEIKGLTITPYHHEIDIAKFDLTLNAFDADDGLAFTFEYCTKLFKADTIDRFITYFCTICADASRTPDTPLASLEIISSEEKRQILEDFNHTAVSYPRDETARRLLALQAEKAPHGTAIVFKEQYLTYGELWARSRSLATKLRQKGAKPGSVIAILAERSLEMIVAVTAIIEAGAIYLPLDASYPPERLTYMLQDSGSRLLLESGGLQVPVSFAHHTLNLDDKKLFTAPVTHTAVEPAPDDPVYLIYTSGSTGKPKGVLVLNTNYVAVTYAWRESYRLDEMENSLLQLAGFAFDVFAGDISRSLLNGGKLTVCPEELKLDFASLYLLIRRHRITLFESTPSLVIPLMEYIYENQLDTGELALLILGSDICPVREFDLINWRFGDRMRVINSYGVTEASIDSSYFEGSLQPFQRLSNVPVGKPLPGVTCRILDEFGHLQPIGITGELIIGGGGIAAGYLNRVELTHERFVPDPLCAGKRLYKTGDLARWLPDGNIEFLGRTDFQVKIRGFRIELGEIENRLLQEQRIKEAVVVLNTDRSGDKYLCAYFVPREPLDIGRFRLALAEELPAHMLPSHFMELNALPLTPNGKVDRKALPQPEASAVGDYSPPQDHLETELVNLWSEVLNIGDNTERPLGIDDNFFQMGGHSLKATVLTARIHRRLKVKVPLGELFRTPHIRGIATLIRESDPEAFAAITATEKREYYPLSSAQKRLYVLQQFDRTSTAYNMPLAVLLEATPSHGEDTLEREKLQEVFTALIHRHESLRTSFEMLEGEPVQRVHDTVAFDVRHLEAKDADSPGEIVSRFVRPFDLSQPPLLRVGVVEKGEAGHLLLVDVHHIVNDGVSQALLFDQFAAVYAGGTLPNLRIQYKDFSQWQNSYTREAAVKRQEDYWTGRFSDFIPVLNLPYDFPRPLQQSFEGDTCEFLLSPAQTAGLKQLALSCNGTLYMVLFALYALLMTKLGGEEDVVIGTPVAGRKHADLEGIVGLMVNMLAIRSKVPGPLPFTDFLMQVKELILEALENQEYQFEDLVDKLTVQRDAGRNPLFDTAFVLQNVGVSDIRLEGLRMKPYETPGKVSRFDMMLVGSESENSVFFTLEYCTRLFKRSTVQRFIDYYKQLVSVILLTPTIPAYQIEVINEEEKKQLLEEFNSPPMPYSLHLPVHKLFQERQAESPHNIALVMGDVHIDYQMLDSVAEVLACDLARKGLGRRHIAALLMRQTPSVIIAMLAILKTGAAYLPIDPVYPPERIRFLLKDSTAHTIITDIGLPADISFDGEVVEIPHHGTLIGSRHDQIAPPGTTGLETDPAYTIYTSGTTGRPKGVLIEHRSLHQLCRWHNSYFNVQPFDRALKYAGIGFDVSVWEIFPYLLIGSALYFPAEDIKLDMEVLNRYLETQCITIASFPTQICEQFQELENRCLRLLVTAGDKLRTFIPRSYTLSNNYGPTEDTVISTTYTVNAHSDNIPIGIPVHGTRVYIVDRYHFLQPRGVPGELCVGGAGLARGYLNRPELTDEKFVFLPTRPERFAGEGTNGDIGDMKTGGIERVGPRVYKTGDLARWLPDGNIEFLGRIDFQVKIRGYRIEPAEIENCLLATEGILGAVVIAREDIPGTNEAGTSGDKYLCAYYVPTPGYTLDTVEISNALALRLADYMIPSFFIPLDAIPLTPNGKIDMRALPVPDLPFTRGEYTAPRDEVEEKLAAAWSEVLGVKDIGVRDNFFQLGGDSIKAIQVASRLRQTNLELKIADLFLYSTIEQLRHHVGDIDRIIDQSPVSGNVPLTPIQSWFFENRFSNSHHFNMSVMLQADAGFNEDFIRKVLTALARHHDALRLVFPLAPSQGEESIQHRRAGVSQHNREVESELFHMEVLDFRETENREQAIRSAAARIQTSFQLEKGPLLKLGLFRSSNADYLLIAVHHLVVDVVSWRILFADFRLAYSLLEQGDSIRLPEKTDSFLRWSHSLRNYAESGKLPEQLPYWLKLEETPAYGPPTGRSLTPKMRKRENLNSIEIRLSSDDTEKLQKDVHWAYRTEINDILLTALGQAIKKWSGYDKILINLEGHGRESIMEDIDISRTVGWFTSQYPVILDMTNSDDLAYVIREVKESLRRIPHKGIGYGILKYLTPAEKTGESTFTQKPEISFNYLGVVDTGESGESGESGEGIGLASIGAGENISPHMEQWYALDINGMIMDGCLQLSFSYNEHQYEESAVRETADGFLAALQDIIRHCTHVEEQQATPSDVGYSAIDIDELEEFEDEFSDID
ncbi:MAG: amino acid adenylation domain-containing protein, partial [bacterium]|nr:amino acid adenylation domain-containing protein [bacterium]